jgi:hypothetical protein
VSFAQNIKKKYPLVLSRINQLVERIKVLGPAAAIDVDQAALRVTLDVIGLVSHQHINNNAAGSLCSADIAAACSMARQHL